VAKFEMPLAVFHITTQRSPISRTEMYDN